MSRRPLRGVRLPKKQRAHTDAHTVTRAVQQHYAGDPAGALGHYVRVLQRDIENPTALYFAALAKDQLGHDRETAIPYMLKALGLMHAQHARADLIADASFNLGKFYLSTGKEDDAFVAYMAALEHNDKHIEAMVGVGDHLWGLGKRDDAVACWGAAMATVPRCPEAAHYRSFVRLRFSDPAGWEDYEARWQCKMFVHTYGRPEYALIPLWVDQELTGKRIIVHGEQGHGDVIQCARYLPLLRERGAEVILEAHKPLVRLLAHSFPWLEVFERETLYPHAVDLQVPSFSLPQRFAGANPNGAYLAPVGDGIDRRVGVTAEQHEWESALMRGEDVGDPPPRRFRVGIAWRGSKTHSNDRNRSCPIEHIAPIWSLPNVDFISLQVGDSADEADGTPLLRPEIRDFGDTAFVIAGCDLVITVDTAVAHLAGALGARVWMMTPPLSEWRWGVDQSTTPLYPSMRIFRQPSRGDWAGVVEQVRGELTGLVEAR